MSVTLGNAVYLPLQERPSSTADLMFYLMGEEMEAQQETHQTREAVGYGSGLGTFPEGWTGLCSSYFKSLKLSITFFFWGVLVTLQGVWRVE